MPVKTQSKTFAGPIQVQSIPMHRQVCRHTHDRYHDQTEIHISVAVTAHLIHQ